jgi:DNA-directed RNA polymerase subunit omega
MIEELREEEIVRKVGGRFKLSTLIQKRLVQINAGARPLVNAENRIKMQVVIDEIMQDKIFLDTEMNVQVAAGVQEPGQLDMDFRNL